MYCGSLTMLLYILEKSTIMIEYHFSFNTIIPFLLETKDNLIKEEIKEMETGVVDHVVQKKLGSMKVKQKGINLNGNATTIQVLIK